LSSLADTYACQGKLIAAKDLHQEVLDLRTETLGSEHPHTLSTMSRLAGLLYKQSRRQDAKDPLSEGFGSASQVLGSRTSGHVIKHRYSREIEWWWWRCCTSGSVISRLFYILSRRNRVNWEEDQNLEGINTINWSDFAMQAWQDIFPSVLMAVGGRFSLTGHPISVCSCFSPTRSLHFDLWKPRSCIPISTKLSYGGASTIT